jgi:hypothetical protein
VIISHGYKSELLILSIGCSSVLASVAEETKCEILFETSELLIFNVFSFWLKTNSRGKAVIEKEW